MHDLKYLYYSIEQKKLLALYFEFGEFDLYPVIFPFEFESKTFSNPTGLVLFCESYNKTTANKYRELYGIKPPYVLHTYISVGGEVVCLFTFHGHKLSVADGLNFPKLNTAVWSQKVNVPLYNFCKQHKDEMFNLSAVIAFHRFFIDSMIITPICPGFFNAKLDGIIYHTEIREDSDFWYLYFSNSPSNEHIFEYYNISKDEVLKVINQKHWAGAWPESSKENLFKLIDYINRGYYANFVYESFKITENSIVSNFGRLDFKQNKKNGGWFLSGNMNVILALLKLESIGDLKARANEILGEQKRSGIFPECNSKTELMTLIKTIRNEHG